MACKGCGGKGTRDEVKHAETADPGVAVTGGWVAQWSRARAKALDLLRGDEFGAGLSSQSGSADIVDSLCAALVACREAEKALQVALEEGADCSAIEAELAECEKQNEDLLNQLDMHNAAHEGDVTEVTADGVPQEVHTPTKPIQTFTVSPPRQPLRKEEVRPGDSRGHVRNVHPVNHPGVRPR